jgi:hypothetical protein
MKFVWGGGAVLRILIQILYLLLNDVLSFHTSVWKSACPTTCQACPTTCPSYLLPVQLPVCMSKGLSGESSYLLFFHFLSVRLANVPICLACPETYLLLQLLPVYLSRYLSTFPDTSLPIQVSFRLSSYLSAFPGECLLFYQTVCRPSVCLYATVSVFPYSNLLASPATCLHV